MELKTGQRYRFREGVDRTKLEPVRRDGTFLCERLVADGGTGTSTELLFLGRPMERGGWYFSIDQVEPASWPTVAQLPPQEQTVLNHLQAEGSITAVEAQAVHRIRSLSRRISTLRQAGWNVEHEDTKDINGQRYRRYMLRGERRA